MGSKEHTNIYFDFEFIDDGRDIIPISVGMCTAMPKRPGLHPGSSAPYELYFEYEFDPACANDWVRANVFPHLQLHGSSQFGVGGGHPRRKVAKAIQDWVAAVCGDTKPQFWGYYPSYDWVLLCQHFGTMMQMPKGWPMRPECLMQMADELGADKNGFPKQENEHHALADAKWNLELHRLLQIGKMLT